MSDDSIIDISRVISSGAVVYPGDDPLGVEPLCTIEPGCPCNIGRLSWSTHFLTHVDVPLHFIQCGDSLTDVPLERFTGEALVIEVDGDSVEPLHFPVEQDVAGKCLLFKTRNSKRSTNDPFDESHVYISADVADLAVRTNVNLVGIDYLSVDRFGDEGYPAHRTLLAGGVLILEGLDLTAAEPGVYTLFALPLHICDGDGSPVRAVLVDRNFPRKC